MPKILVYKYLTFFFYAGDLINEPGHVHVVNNKSFLADAKIWFEKNKIEGGVGIAESGNLSDAELRIAVRIVKANKNYLITQWDKFKSGQKTSIKILKKI
jgi:hypothetical protein